ncbi:HAD family hydrolase [Dactylosporangium sp. CA-233914]|uniref:HAD family hydrolase n=1 Tax=Dactylosporangium sp. CA-233914 TaxID=3239934 RepID=UPI003D8E6506
MDEGPYRGAVLFDLDGTLIDSEPVWAAANSRLLRSRHAEMTDEILHNLSGLDSTLAMRYLHDRFGWVDLDVTGDVAWVENQVRQEYAEGVNWLPGARELLAAVRREGLAIGLVTSTYRTLVSYVLADAGPDCFDVVVCGDDEGLAPKPAPAPYRRAMQLLDLPASACIAVEDSARGVASALAAGCRVVHVSRHGFSPRAHRHARRLADITAADLLQLLGVPRASYSALPTGR